MSEETELFIEIWSRLSVHIHVDERVEASRQLLISFVEHGHDFIVEELMQHQSELDKFLSSAVASYEEE